MTTADRLAESLGARPPLRLARRGPSGLGRLVARLAAALRPGDVVALVGPLGAGKTWLVSRVCQALGLTPQLYVTSPTYTVANLYDTTPAVAHLDLYRLATVDDFHALGGEEYFSPRLVTFVEWADRLPSIFPDDTAWLGLEPSAPLPRGRTLSVAATLDQLPAHLARVG